MVNAKTILYSSPDINNTSNIRHRKPRPTSHCMVLPPGEFSSVSTQPLPDHAKSFMTIRV